MELALLLFMLMKSSSRNLLQNKQTNPEIPHYPTAEPAPDTSAETMREARKRYEEELKAFQDLMNYNSDVAYGIDRTNEE